MHYSEGAMWRPLFEQDIAMLQVASGCSHCACKFCDMYHIPFQASPFPEIEADVEELTRGWRVPARLFLTGGNAFHLDFAFLMRVIGLVHEKLPQVRSIGCFARVDDIAGKTDEELKALLDAGVDMISIGAESGLDEALERMNKGFRAADIVEQCARLDAVGMSYAFFYLAGIAGKGRGIENARASVEAFSQVNPAILMIHTMTPFPGTPLAREIDEGAFELEPEIEIMQELRELYATYPKRTRMLAMHYANTVTFDGYVPDARDSMVKIMDKRIAAADEESLEIFRRSIRSI